MSAEGRLPVAVAGLGPIGREVVLALLDRPELELVAVMDVDPSLLGQSLSELVGRPAGALRIEEESRSVLGRASGGALLQLTGSRVPTVIDQIERAIAGGVNVISSCEELTFPWLNHPELAERLEKLAAKADVSVLGAGVNPGFVLDRLVVTLGAVTGKVRRVVAERVVDASTRREQLQRKVGAGMTREQFERAVQAGRVGHVGLAESAALISAGLGLNCDEFEESIDPFMATRPVAGPISIDVGRVAGSAQVVRGFSDGREVVTLSTTIAIGAADPHDEIRIEGEPPIHFRSNGGIAGDRATAWSLVNSIPAVVTAEPGLLTVLDLPAGR
ncbi:MAG: NAD(P)H-dependent amine dehydrogenase family protein [Deltaproteobacteria bacterium]